MVYLEGTGLDVLIPSIQILEMMAVQCLLMVGQLFVLHP